MGAGERIAPEDARQTARPVSPRLDLRVRATPGAVSTVRGALGRLGLPATVLEDARLLVSELVTNSIRHAGLQPSDEVRVRAAWSGSRLRVDVHDGCRPLPAPGPGVPGAVAGAIRPDPGSESGWGLYLVDRLAGRWGRGPGRHWFELEHDPAREPAYAGGSSSRAT